MSETKVQLSNSFLVVLKMVQMALAEIGKPRVEPIVLSAELIGSEVLEKERDGKKEKLRFIQVKGDCLSVIGEVDFDCKCEIRSGKKFYWEPSKIEVRVGGFEGAYVFEEEIAGPFGKYQIIAI